MPFLAGFAAILRYLVKRDMKLTPLSIAAAVLALSLHAQFTIPPTAIPTGTGAAADPFTGNDQNWSIVANSITVEPIGVPDEARIVVSKGNGWGSIAGGAWIAPDQNQSNHTNAQERPGTCGTGSTTYEYQFQISDPAHEQFNMTILAVRFGSQRLRRLAHGCEEIPRSGLDRVCEAEQY